MEIKVNRWLAVLLTVIVAAMHIFPVPVFYGIAQIIYPGEYEICQISDLLIANLRFVIASLGSVIIGISLCVMAGKFGYDRWTWIVIGLVYGQYSLVLFCVIIVVERIDSFRDLIGTIQIALVLFLLSNLLNFAMGLLKPYTTDAARHVDSAMYYQIGYLASFWILIPIFLNLVFVVKIRTSLKTLTLKSRIVWIATMTISGILPFILFNQLLLIRRKLAE